MNTWNTVSRNNETVTNNTTSSERTCWHEMVSLQCMSNILRMPVCQFTFIIPSTHLWRPDHELTVVQAGPTVWQVKQQHYQTCHPYLIFETGSWMKWNKCMWGLLFIDDLFMWLLFPWPHTQCCNHKLIIMPSITLFVFLKSAVYYQPKNLQYTLIALIYIA